MKFVKLSIDVNAKSDKLVIGINEKYRLIGGWTGGKNGWSSSIIPYKKSTYSVRYYIFR